MIRVSAFAVAGVATVLSLAALAAIDKPECIVGAKPGGGFDLTCKLAQQSFQDLKLIKEPMRATYMPGGILDNDMVVRAITAEAIVLSKDGREIIYFDHDDAPTRTVDDQRSLTDKAGLGELRYDPFTGEWIAVAGHRQTRIFLPSAAECPLCPSRDGLLSEIPDAQYDVVVFENRFPSLRDPEGDWSRPTAEWGAVAPAAGRCEVVCFSDDHNGAFKLLSPAAARLAIDAWVDRTAAMAALPYIRQVFPFENRGEEIGVTLHHPHGQIYGYSYVPPRMAKLMELAVAYRTQHHRHLIADVVAKEAFAR